MMPTAKRVATWRTEHSKRALVEKLDFVTAAGNLQTVVTPIAVLQKRNGRLALESWNPRVTRDEVVQRTGFVLNASAATETGVLLPAPVSMTHSAGNPGMGEGSSAAEPPAPAGPDEQPEAASAATAASAQAHLR